MDPVRAVNRASDLMATLLPNAPAASKPNRDSEPLDLAPLRRAARDANESQLFEAAAQTLMARGAKGFAVFEILTENQARCRFGATAEGGDEAEPALVEFTGDLQRRLCPTAADAVRLASQQVRLLASDIQLLVVATPVGANLAAVTWHRVAREFDLKGTTWQEDAAAVGAEIVNWHSVRAAAMAASQTAGQPWLQAAAQALSNTTLETAARALAHTLKAELGCDLAALGVRLTPHSPIRLAGASHVGDVDAGSEQILLLQELMRHAAALNTTLRHPAEAEVSSAAAQSLQRFAAEGGHQSIVVAPLTVGGETVGAWIAAGDRELSARADSRLPPVTPLLGACLTAVARGAASPWRQLRQQATAAIRGRWLWTMAAGLTLLVLISLLPWPYRLKAPCVCEPVVRRFIAAPFEGTLQKVIVRPGDHVVAGDVLAVLDGGELRSELAGLEAKRRQAEQRYSAALASGAAADAYREQMESRHLETQIQVFQQREGQLEIRSPISGVVVSGDQERAEGAPVAIGQKLFEVAPLDQLIAEVEIPESEIRNVEAGQQATLCFDAVSGRHRGALLRVHPRTEMRDDQSVFIAEVELNLPPEARIQPGMHGVARIHTGRRAIGWIWLHRPYWALRRASGW